MIMRIRINRISENGREREIKKGGIRNEGKRK